MRKSLLLLTLPLSIAAPSAGAEEEAHIGPDRERSSRLACDVAVIGGGAGGLHTAFRLGAKYGSRVCLFEKEARLGGRIYDVPLRPGGPVFGAGALRVMEGQTVVFNLAQELGISLEAAPWRDDLISARGHFGGTSDELNVSAYPLVADTITETDLYDRLRLGPERARARSYPDFRSYVRAVVGSQGYHFLTDVFRFRADFEYPLSAAAYLEYLDEEWDVCCTPSYPTGGMSEFIRRMEQRATSAGVRIYKSEPAQEIWRLPGRRYLIHTPHHSVTTGRLVIAVDAEAFKRVGGNVAEAIKAQRHFQDLIGVKVVTIAQWWPEAWWLGAVPGKDVRRAWTTEQCLNHIEIPIASYAANQKVTRTVYDDDIRCVNFWEATAARSLSAVNDEIRRGLAYLFPGVRIPSPIKTHVQVWPAAWYWLRAGSRFSNADIARWALAPLPGEHISLVGESYNPQRSGWSDGAYKSSINTLNAHYGFALHGATLAELRSADDAGTPSVRAAALPGRRARGGIAR